MNPHNQGPCPCSCHDHKFPVPLYEDKPRLIVLVRHGESESNKDKAVNEYVPNHLIKLTERGHNEARAAGLQLLQLLNLDNEDLVRDVLAPKHSVVLGAEPECGVPQNAPGLPVNNYCRLERSIDENIVFYTSPYRRTKETLKGIIDVIDEYNELNCGVRLEPDEKYEPGNKHKHAFWPRLGNFSNSEPRNPPSRSGSLADTNAPKKTYLKYSVKEEPRIREQDFGNYQQVESMKDVMKARAKYGHFFFRFPQGESTADVYDRVASFQESLFRKFQRHPHNRRSHKDVVVLVTHGIYCRVFLMKWFRWTYEEYESFINVPNGSLMVMELDPSIDRYVLRTELPKWTT